MIAYAATIDAAQFGNVVDPIIANVVNPIVEVMFAIALVVFAWGILQMVIHRTDAEEHSRGRWSMLSGLIGMFIMLSAWGIINIIANTVGQF